jgi:hypothetical protein
MPKPQDPQSRAVNFPLVKLIPKRRGRLVECRCEVCGYIACIPRQWFSLAGPPTCPSDGARLREVDVERLSDIAAMVA